MSPSGGGKNKKPVNLTLDIDLVENYIPQKIKLIRENAGFSFSISSYINHLILMDKRKGEKQNDARDGSNKPNS